MPRVGKTDCFAGDGSLQQIIGMVLQPIAEEAIARPLGESATPCTVRRTGAGHTPPGDFNKGGNLLPISGGSKHRLRLGAKRFQFLDVLGRKTFLARIGFTLPAWSADQLAGDVASSGRPRVFEALSPDGRPPQRGGAQTYWLRLTVSGVRAGSGPALGGRRAPPACSRNSSALLPPKGFLGSVRNLRPVCGDPGHRPSRFQSLPVGPSQKRYARAAGRAL
jgi:hypothetical protein